MIAPKFKPEVKLAGKDGNAFSIMARVSTGLREAGADEEYIENYREKAMSGNYDDLLVISMGEINHV